MGSTQVGCCMTLLLWGSACCTLGQLSSVELQRSSRHEHRSGAMHIRCWLKTSKSQLCRSVLNSKGNTHERLRNALPYPRGLHRNLEGSELSVLLLGKRYYALATDSSSKLQGNEFSKIPIVAECSVDSVTCASISFTWSVHSNMSGPSFICD